MPTPGSSAAAPASGGPPCPHCGRGDDGAPRFAQPKGWLRWLAVLLAAAGWYVAWYSFRVSAGVEVRDALMEALCRGGEEPAAADGCAAVLTSDYAYWRVGGQASHLRIPTAVFGMGYFLFVAAWYLFVGPPTRSRAAWHLVILAAVLAGAGYSLYYLHVMASVLQQWCNSCLAAHGLNGALLLLTLLAFPWRPPRRPAGPHPSARLALAAALVGVLLLAVQFGWVFVNISGSLFRQADERLARIVRDPAYILWDFERQAVVDLPLGADELFAGSPTAPHTVVSFSDFRCRHCQEAHAMLVQVAEKHPDRLRLAFRYYPQDSVCNPNPKFRLTSHGVACRAARAAEAARRVGDRDTALRYRKLLWERQHQLPERQPDQQRQLLEDWAAELGLDRAAFAAALESPAVSERIAADVALADRLGISEVPVLYLNGKRLAGWSRMEVWDVLLGAPGPATRPAAATPEPAP